MTSKITETEQSKELKACINRIAASQNTSNKSMQDRVGLFRRNVDDAAPRQEVMKSRLDLYHDGDLVDSLDQGQSRRKKEHGHVTTNT